MGILQFFKRCPHKRVTMVYGDEINYRGGYRWKCVDCGGTVRKFKADTEYMVIPYGRKR